MPYTNQQVIEDLTHRAIERIGRSVSDYRGRTGLLTQEKLATALGFSRTAVAHLEEGRELPDPGILTRVCEHLKMPRNEWIAATHPYYTRGYICHQLLCEMVGRQISLLEHAATDQWIALDRFQTIFENKLTGSQAHAQFNALLIFYGERPVTAEFFTHYLDVDAFASSDAFLGKLRRYQTDAMRLYGNFRRAFTCMSRAPDLKTERSPVEPRPLKSFEGRAPFCGIRSIPPARLADLGYIAAQRISQQNRERLELSGALTEIAKSIEETGVSAAPTALPEMLPRKLSRIRTLLRKFESPLQLETSLFSTVDPVAIRSEAARIAPAESDLTRISVTQGDGLHNLGVYLSEPFMDVYVATSMREDADFHSVNAFVEQLFGDDSVRPLNLRYFNPTQSWIEDRVSKGLVEALMLRRSAVTVYMAQKGDTFGKDSEASVALGQGKTVIVYVPRLFDAETNIDSEQICGLDAARLEERLVRLGSPSESDLDAREKARNVLKLELAQMSESQFKRVLFLHWADFDLDAEFRGTDNHHLRHAVAETLSSIRACKDAEAATGVKMEGVTRAELTDKIVLVADRFESRAKLFRDTHPLSLQVIVRSGVLNGILVARSVSECARLLRGVLANSLEYDVEVDEFNYRLVERGSRSTIRVVSRHKLLTFAFWTQYFDQDNLPAQQPDVHAGSL